MADGVQLILLPGILRLIGLRAIALIRKRTEEGKDADDREFLPYSTRPFAMPAGALTVRARSGLKGQLSYFRKPHGALWAVVHGGYAAYKRAAYPQDDGKVNLTVTGGMLAAMTVLGVDTRANLVRIGFTRQEEAEKAFWHNELGAGKSRAIRKWFGLTNRDLDDLMKLAGTAVTVST